MIKGGKPSLLSKDIILKTKGKKENHVLSLCKGPSTPLILPPLADQQCLLSYLPDYMPLPVKRSASRPQYQK